MSTKANITQVHSWGDILSLYELVSIDSITQESGHKVIFDGGHEYNAYWGSDELVGKVFQVKAYKDELVLQHGVADYYFNTEGLVLKVAHRDNMLLSVTDSTSNSPDEWVSLEGASEYPSEVTGESSQGLNEKVIPTQGVHAKVLEKSLQELLGDTTCPIAKKVTERMLERAKFGLDKYGVTADRDDLSLVQWLTHAQEEAMDLAVYLEKIKKILKGGNYE